MDWKKHDHTLAFHIVRRAMYEVVNNACYPTTSCQKRQQQLLSREDLIRAYNRLTRCSIFVGWHGNRRFTGACPVVEATTLVTRALRATMMFSQATLPPVTVSSSHYLYANTEEKKKEQNM